MSPTRRRSAALGAAPHQGYRVRHPAGRPHHGSLRPGPRQPGDYTAGMGAGVVGGEHAGARPSQRPAGGAPHRLNAGGPRPVAGPAGAHRACIVYGHPGRVVVTDNRTPGEGQVRGFRHPQRKMEAGIRTFQEEPTGGSAAPRPATDPHFVTLAPLFHCTDSKVRVPAAYCVLAWLVASLPRREARTAAFWTSRRNCSPTSTRRGSWPRPAGASGPRRASPASRPSKRASLSTEVWSRITRRAHGGSYTATDGNPRPAGMAFSTSVHWEGNARRIAGGPVRTWREVARRKVVRARRIGAAASGQPGGVGGSGAKAGPASAWDADRGAGRGS